ncbi:MAG: hypothetical protein Fur0016_20390 [Anaerolineales bacterium]
MGQRILSTDGSDDKTRTHFHYTPSENVFELENRETDSNTGAAAKRPLNTSYKEK